MAGSAPIILLIEDDGFDRKTLTCMLQERGFGVMSTDVKHAIITFDINHQQLALVLASARLSDSEKIWLGRAMNRTDARVPLVIAPPRASHRPNSGQDSGRQSAFAALLSEVERRLNRFVVPELRRTRTSYR